ncbi:MAG TPA: preprotein translocase subunit SecY [Oligoflexia bacterium]|nr:preprotein translocase subunit SecY [Oligoflexia bacterium]HMP49803.1 preprotein translocase subunit SecY [Oligoflexia bacterium]
MIPGLQNAASIPELRKRALFTLSMLMIYRIGVFVPVPGIDAEKFKEVFNQAASTVFGMVNMFSGGAIENFSILALGIMPYISVSIIMQLLTHTVKHLEDLSKEGAAGKAVITRYTRIGTIVLAIIQGAFISAGLQSQGLVADTSSLFVVKTAITLAAGTAFVMWLGEQITERGIGNGASLIICAGIIARMPSTLLQTLDLMNEGGVEPVNMLGVFIFGLITVAFIVYVERSQRKIPVQYPKRVVGGRMMSQSAAQHMPLKLNTAGVIPPIFASALLFFPATIAQIGDVKWIESYLSYLAPGSGVYEVVFASLIIFFAYFYTALMFDPNQLAENLKKNGGFIPTVRPGKDTSEFFMKVLGRLTLWGSLYLALICILPQLVYEGLGAGSFSYFFGGTAVLIVVGVTMDLVAQIQSHLYAKSYEAFLEKGPQKIRGASRATQVGGKLIRR